MFPRSTEYSRPRDDSRTRAISLFMNHVYRWMAVGVALTGVVAYLVAGQPQLVAQIVGNQLLFIGLVVLQLGAVLALSAWVQRMSLATASLVYLGYAALTGVTFSTVFLAYTMESISSTFFVTAFAFAGLSVFGYTTNRDLGPVGSFCMIGLFGMIAVMLLSFFVPSMMGNTMQMVMASIGVLVFAGLTAYDTQRIKAMSLGFGSRDAASKGAIYGALMLYLDFINLFINLLRLLGDRR